MTNPPRGSQHNPQRIWIVPFSDEEATNNLIAALRQSRRYSAPRSTDTLEFIMDRYAGLTVEIHAREHPPPHFHVSCAGGEASYSIADCRQIDGKLRGEYRKIRSWHAKNRQKLIDEWNGSRPADCPVGPYRD